VSALKKFHLLQCSLLEIYIRGIPLNEEHIDGRRGTKEERHKRNVDRWRVEADVMHVKLFGSSAGSVISKVPNKSINDMDDLDSMAWEDENHMLENILRLASMLLADRREKVEEERIKEEKPSEEINSDGGIV
jgi:hypothetical protein